MASDRDKADSLSANIERNALVMQGVFISAPGTHKRASSWSQWRSVKCAADVDRAIETLKLADYCLIVRAFAGYRFKRSSGRRPDLDSIQRLREFLGGWMITRWCAVWPLNQEARRAVEGRKDFYAEFSPIRVGYLPIKPERRSWM